MYSKAFEAALNHAMLYEVGGFWKLTPDVESGLISTPAQRQAVGYTNTVGDAGGETKFGVAKNANKDIDVTHLTWTKAKDIYYNKYWLAGHCDQMDGRVAVLHFDGCVNNGIGGAAKFLQRAVGVTADGAIGNGTLTSLKIKDPIAVCNSICDQRVKYYNDIVAAKPDQVKFLKGWMRRIDEMRAFTTNASISFS